MSYSVPGVKVYDDRNGRHVILEERLTLDTFSRFLTTMMRDGLAFSLYDPRYPSLSDPAAYLSYSPSRGEWRMTLGNHGWSGDIYTVASPTIAKQLFNLYRAGELSPLGLDRVCFFSHYYQASASKNERMNALLEEIHTRGPRLPTKASTRHPRLRQSGNRMDRYGWDAPN